jgi:hypothetical protein
LKKNLILFFIATGLATFTYFFQELKDRKAFSEAESRGVLLDPKKLGELKSIHLPKVSLRRQGKQYLLSSGEIADERKIDWFMNILAGIRTRRVIPKDTWDESNRSQFFANNNEKMEFQFEKGRVSFLLGKKLDFDQSFYMEVINGNDATQVVAFDAGDMETIYDKEQGHRSDHRYRRFQSLFYIDAAFFKDYRMFRHWMGEKWSLLEVTIDNKGNRKYSLNFPEARTSPAIPFFLARNEQMMKAFEDDLIKLEGKIYADGPLEKSELLSEMVVNSTQGELRLKLYRHQGNKKYYIHSSFDNRSYEIEDKRAQVFLRPVQDFWDLRPFSEIPKNAQFIFPNKSVTQVSFSQENGRFVATAQGREAVHQAFSQLFKYLKEPAKYWVAGEAYEEAFIEQFGLDWGLGPFFLMIRSGEILLYHKEKKQGLIYPLEGSPPFPVLEEQYFK